MNPLPADTLPRVMEIARRAGDAILVVYHRPEGFAVSDKADTSPLTEADLAAHGIIEQALRELTPDIPVLSEESGEHAAWSVRRHWRRFWLVDPLDGTKEFVAKSGEFTVNIALVQDGVPVLGVVYVPVTGVAYAGEKNRGAFREDAQGRSTIHVRTLAQQRAAQQPVTVVASRRHGGERLPALLDRLQRELGDYTLANMSSSLKICLVAEGKADIYPRLGPTSEWDTAAAQAVLEAAGGHLVGPDLAPLRCNRGESLLNPDFHALGDDVARWRWLAEFDLTISDPDPITKRS